MNTNMEPALPAASAAMYDRDRACRALGIQVVEVEPGRASLRMRVTAAMINGHAIAHGGYLFLLADSAFAYACNAYGPVTVAHSAQIAFLQPVAVDEELRADAVERARYGRNGVYDVTVRRSDGAVVAEFRGQSVALVGNPTAT